MIVRDPHNGNFTQLSNRLLDDQRIKPVDKYIMWLLLRNVDQWQGNKRQVKKESGLNKGTVLSSFRRLEAFGYLRKVSGGRGEDGRIKTDKYDIIENPNLQPSPKNGDGKTATEKQSLQNGGGKTTSNNTIGNNTNNLTTTTDKVLLITEERQEQELKDVLKNNEAVRALADVGVNPARAKVLVEKYGENHCLRNLKYAKQTKNGKTNFPGYVVYCIENDLSRGQNLFDEIQEELKKEEKEKEMKESDERLKKDFEKNYGDYEVTNPMWKKKKEEYAAKAKEKE